MRYIAFDTETTGQYPIASEIVEIAAVRFGESGGEIDTYQSLIKPTRPMSDFIIGIHGITNEMTANARVSRVVLKEFIDYIGDDVLLAHHAQFDLGFLASDLERVGLPLPKNPTLCTSLLAQALVQGTENHKLQTLVQHYGIDPGQAHRALDDARSCRFVAEKLIELRCAELATELGQAIDSHHKDWLDLLAAPMYRKKIRTLRGGDGVINGSGPLFAGQFSLNELCHNQDWANLIEAIKKSEPCQVVYEAGSKPGQSRPLLPVGIIRQISGDTLVAEDYDLKLQVGLKPAKRYWLKQVSKVKPV